MRLTLRTMLAYMDEILEPEDAQAIGKKIEESEFATTLLHRTREVMRRLRLGAPDLKEGGGGLDPNTVADYLDHTLSDDRVPDFEKICLESDAHLAEVASCHQILTLVLGAPAEVDAPSRQRMYRLPEIEAEEAKAAEPASEAVERDAAGQGRGDGHQAQPRRRKPVVPEYLREPPKRRRFWPAAAAFVLTLFFAVAVLAALGQFKPGTPLGDFLGFGKGDAPVARRPDSAREEDPFAETVADEADASDQDESPQGEPPEPEEPEAEQAAAAEASAEPAAAEASAEPVTAEASGEPVAKVDTAAKTAPPITPPAESPPAADDAGKTETTPSPPTEVAAEPKGDRPPRPATEDNDSGDAAAVLAKADPARTESQPPAEPAEEAAPAQRLGRFVSEGVVLLRSDPDSAAWQRVPAQGVLTTGYRLLALPTCRPLIALTTGVTVQIRDGTEIELESTDKAGVPGLIVFCGRLVMRTVGKAGAQVRLQVGNRSGEITFGDAESAVALEVICTRIPGTDPQAQPAPRTAVLYAVSGQISWNEAGLPQPVSIEAPSRLTLDDQPPRDARAVPELPSWTHSNSLSPLDRQAAATLEQALTQQRPVSRVLQELAEHRRREVRWMAVRCLGYIGEFGPLVAALNEPGEKTSWEKYIEFLQRSLARGPQAAAQVQQTLQMRYGSEDGPRLYRMLWGFTDKDLRDGEAAMDLVEYLDHQALAFRVLSFSNLVQIAQKGFFYKPEDTAAKRQGSIRRWREWLESDFMREKPAAEKAAGGGPSSALLPEVEPR